MSLLAWYPLMGNTKNYGLGDAEPTVTATPVYIDGKMGKAMSSGGIKWLASQTKKILNNNELTIAFWLYVDKLASESSGNTSQLLFGNDGGSSGRQYTLFLYPNVNTLHWSWGGVKGGSGIFSNIIPSKQWTHVCVTYKNPTGTVYINGVQTNTFSTVANADSFEFDTQVIHNYNFLHMQDYRIYDHALSKREVKELAKGLTIHLPMNWGTGKPNMIKNSYTWMNKNAGSHWVSTGAITKAVLEDDTAPCKWVYKVTKNNSEGTASANGGAFYGYTAQGVELTDLVEGETYTYSFWAKADPSNDTSFNLQAGSICESQTLVSSTGFTNLDSNWRKHTVTFKWTKTTKLTACFYCTTPTGKTQIFYCCGLKLEKGDTATPYIPHVNETAYTEKGFGVNYKDECSGYNRGITSGGTAVIGEESPRGTGTYCTSGCYLQATSGFPLSSAMPSWTIALWFKPDIGKTFTSWSDVFRFWMNTETGNNTHFRLETQNSSGNNYCLYYNNSGASSYGGGALTTITENKWYHLAFCCDSTKIYQYVNSELKITHTINTGYKPTGPTGYFQIGDGGMYASYADVRVYATCLSADDIKELYQIPVQIDKTGKVYCNNLVEV